MTFLNTQTSWGWVSIVMHWLSAVAIIALFAFGLWMDGLSYDHPWYQSAPHWHQSVGVLLVLMMIGRWFWRRYVGQVPNALVSHKAWEQTWAKRIHYVFYVLVMFMFVSGYLVVTAEGQGLSVFSWFTVPAVFEMDDLEDIAGGIHWFCAYSIIILALLHALAALKHQFIDNDGTLLRMFGKSS